MITIITLSHLCLIVNIREISIAACLVPTSSITVYDFHVTRRLPYKEVSCYYFLMTFREKLLAPNENRWASIFILGHHTGGNGRWQSYLDLSRRNLLISQVLNTIIAAVLLLGTWVLLNIFINGITIPLDAKGVGPTIVFAVFLVLFFAGVGSYILDCLRLAYFIYTGKYKFHEKNGIKRIGVKRTEVSTR